MESIISNVLFFAHVIDSWKLKSIQNFKYSKLYIAMVRSEEKKSAHVFVCITRIMLGLDKNQSNQQKVHILRIPNW